MVFGGSRGIGAAAASRLAADGFAVALTYVSRPDKAAEVVSAIEAAGGTALSIRADSADPTAIRAATAQTAEALGQIDVVVVNAGIIRIATVDAFTLEDLDLMLAVNVRGVFLAIQAAASHMRDGGRIITIGSNTAVRTGTPGASVYAMTKAAVASMAKGVALDLAPRGITVNNIQPGPTETDMTAGMIPQLREMIPLRRVGQPAEIAGLISYLASDQAGYMTGASLTIDGGFVL
ncbi:oxidoreductase [Sphingopyxis sp. H038]|nr:oxidoreductase [Sphingopyxis sp. H012]KTE05068.1 oxidoreductase [Sphingopyxis sp. H093]KTE06268.1 oxidoreductase [Sphingopyxis sp. H053]KTE19458.1 oxidoreductase [Sphingopyxis sp. H057]KTE20410.1 oxidoreductase [Sphingopyxis sp. H080]KTE30856.1 oxidoreductase [Sphingopyxis sp. H038]KTE37382.1 oxidoreductase [Sphingopyxis sp. H077]KTE39250.1 oxidoreductase [Sphingopyxis sp. H005]KTE48536.1 oxidoreductase [Sphingopyxis sp. H073]KTE48953.1 oxidoreductase [Sphingopyxis sp. H071]KTE53868.1 